MRSRFWLCVPVWLGAILLAPRVHPLQAQVQDPVALTGVFSERESSLAAVARCRESGTWGTVMFRRTANETVFCAAPVEPTVACLKTCGDSKA